MEKFVEMNNEEWQGKQNGTLQFGYKKLMRKQRAYFNSTTFS